MPEWSPDFGEAKFVPSWGATVTGVRKFLIAYNINLVSTKEQAHRIALNLRSQGRKDQGPGRLEAVQGIGWWLAEKNIAQVSSDSVQCYQLKIDTVNALLECFSRILISRNFTYLFIMKIMLTQTPI